jgi:hypothetical protein
MDPKKDQKISTPLPGVPPRISVSRERELPPPNEAPELDAEVSRIVQIIQDHTDQSRPIIQPSAVSVQVPEPKAPVRDINYSLLKKEAKESPNLPTTWRAVITLFERVKQPLKGKNLELSSS